jgi:predicted RNase H-like nuclease (RuvC/YqgF family)
MQNEKVWLDDIPAKIQEFLDIIERLEDENEKLTEKIEELEADIVKLEDEIKELDKQEQNK